MATVTDLNQLLEQHLVLDLECLDRIYLNAYVPTLQTGGSVRPVGVALLGWSRVWPTRAKLIATLVPSGGYSSLALLNTASALWTATLPPVECSSSGCPCS